MQSSELFTNLIDNRKTSEPKERSELLTQLSLFKFVCLECVWSVCGFFGCESKTKV